MDNKFLEYLPSMDIVSILDEVVQKLAEENWKDDTSDGKDLIEKMSKVKIENRTKQVIEEIFVNEYNEDIMREIMLKMIPDIFASIIFKRMESALFHNEYDYYKKIQNMVASKINSELNRRRY